MQAQAAEEEPARSRIGAHAVHPAAEIFPMLEGVAFDALCADIKANGLRTPIMRIWVDAGLNNHTREPLILDGRNRLRACLKTGVAPHWCEFEGGGDPVAYVVSVNLHRRHLNDGQRAMVAARIASLPVGNPNRTNVLFGSAPTQEQAAKLLNVTDRLVRRAKRVLREADSETVAAVERGEMRVGTAETRSVEGTAPKKLGPATEAGKAVSFAALERVRELQRLERAERDAEVSSLLESGLSVGEVAERLRVSRGSVFDSKRRLGLTKNASRLGNPLAGLTEYAVEFTDTWEGALGKPAAAAKTKREGSR